MSTTNDLQTPHEENLSTLVTGILHDAQELFRQQMLLFRREFQEDMRKTRTAAMPMALGVWLAILGSILLSATLALILVAAGLPEWAAFAIVGAALFLIGGGLFYAGKKQFDSFNPLPDESAKALKENLEWLTKPK
jgi:hypothetical protein